MRSEEYDIFNAIISRQSRMSINLHPATCMEEESDKHDCGQHRSLYEVATKSHTLHKKDCNGEIHLRCTSFKMIATKGE